MNRRSRKLEHARNLAVAHAQALVRARNLADDRDLASALADVRSLAGDLASALADVRDRDLASVLADAFAHDFADTSPRNLASTVERALEHAQLLERSLQAVALKRAPGDASSTPGRVPRGLVALAVRVLPMEEQPRYADEFRVELGELPRRERLGYALRVLAHAWELRRALTKRVRTSDGAPARRATERGAAWRAHWVG